MCFSGCRRQCPHNYSAFPAVLASVLCCTTLRCKSSLLQASSGHGEAPIFPSEMLTAHCKHFPFSVCTCLGLINGKWILKRDAGICRAVWLWAWLVFCFWNYCTVVLKTVWLQSTTLSFHQGHTLTSTSVSGIPCFLQTRIFCPWVSASVTCAAWKSFVAWKSFWGHSGELALVSFFDIIGHQCASKTTRVLGICGTGDIQGNSGCVWG